MRFNKKLLFIYLLPLVLSGCGGETNEQNQQNSHQEAVSSPVATDNYSQFLLDESQHVVSLAEHVSDPQGLPLTLERVEPLSQSCSTPIVDKRHLSFTVAESIPETCVYRYVVRNHPENPQLVKESRAESVVLLSNDLDAPLLPPLSKATEVDSEIGIDLRQEPDITLPSGYTLEEEIVVLGEGSASADIVTNTIYYQASSISGNTRLIYTLSSDDGNNVKMGYIDVAVSSKGNGMPIANNIAGPESLLPNSVITIDVIDAISDPDGDPLQLTDVYAYNANVAVTDPLDVYNTKFNFSASKPGVYNVTYYVSDHRGGFAVAIVRIVVSELPLPWSDIVITNGEHYTAPWEQRAADASKVFYQGVQNEVIDGTNYSLALFDHATAEALCLSRGMLLPTNEQLTNLYDERPDIDVTDHWPVTINYWASSQEPSSTHQAMDIRTGEFMSVDSATPLIVTCVYPGELLVELSKDNAYQTSSVDGDCNIVDAYVKHADGSVMSGQNVYVFSDEDNLRFEEQHKPTDENGKASFKVRSALSGEFEVLVNYYSQTLSTVVTFVEDMLEKITISGQQTLLVGETATLKANGTYQSGEHEDVTSQSSWHSSDVSTVSVSQEGEVVALKEGTASVFARLNEVDSDSLLITVLKTPVLTRVIAYPHSTELEPDERKQLTAIAYYDDNTTKEVTSFSDWSSSSDQIATVDAKGVVTGQSAGTVTIFVNYEEMNSYTTVEVGAGADTLEKITISGQQSFFVGDTATLKATGTYQSGDKEDITSQVSWQSSDVSTISVNQEGEIVALKEGTATVFASLNGVESNSLLITVKPEELVLVDFYAAPNSFQQEVGETMQLYGVAVYDDGTKEAVNTSTDWASTDPSIATVDANGLFTSKSPGRATIYAFYKGYQSIINASVVDNESSNIDNDWDGAIGSEDENPHLYDSMVALNAITQDTWGRSYWQIHGRGSYPSSTLNHYVHVYHDGTVFLNTCPGTQMFSPQENTCRPQEKYSSEELQQQYEQSLPSELKQMILNVNDIHLKTDLDWDGAVSSEDKNSNLHDNMAATDAITTKVWADTYFRYHKDNRTNSYPVSDEKHYALRYYSNGKVYLNTCPNQQVFDAQTRRCINPESVPPEERMLRYVRSIPPELRSRIRSLAAGERP